MKFRPPEIFLGVFLAVAIFAMGMTFSSTIFPAKSAEQQQTSQQHSPEKAGGNSAKTQSLWIPTDSVGLYTLVLAVFTGLLTLVSAAQGYFLLRADKTARIAANAAELSARAAVALELPVFRIFPDKLGWGDTHIGDKIRAYCNVNAVRFQNVGKTRAIPIEIRYGYTVGTPLPPVPSYQFADRFLPENVFDANPQTNPEKRLNGDIEILPEDWPMINSAAKDFWFYCDFTFEDFMEVRHDVGMCWKWTYTGNGMAWRRDRTPAYNRKT